MLRRFAPLVPIALSVLLAACAGQLEQAHTRSDETPVAAVAEKPEPSIVQARPRHQITRTAPRAIRPAASRPLHAVVPPNPADNILEHGMSLVGTRYRFGGASAKTGFDCSGFVGYLFREEAGIQLPRSTREMINLNAPRIARSNLKPGDVIFFNNRGRGRVSHAGIYLGDNRFIHSSSHRSGGVRVDSLGDSYWQRSYMEAKRVLAMAPAEKR